jgi:transposase
LGEDGPRTVAYYRVQRFDAEGFAGLAEAVRPGRPSRLESKHLERIASAPRCFPSDFGLAADFWDGKTLSAFIARKWAIALGVRQYQRLFRRLVPVSFLLIDI